MNIFKRFIALLITVLLTGCVTTMHQSQYDIGTSHLDEGNYEAAYRFFEDSTHYTAVADKMSAYPELREAALQTFSPEALQSSVQEYGIETSLRTETRRLSKFKEWASAEEFATAKANINEQYSPEKIANFEKEEARKEAARTWYGVIASAQAVNRSTAGTSGGSNLGAAVAQAAYIDSSSWGNYSAGAQLAAGLVGAMLGSSMNKSAVEQHQIVYYLKTPSGEMKKFESSSSSPILLPVGGCAKVYEPSRIDLTEAINCNPADNP